MSEEILQGRMISIGDVRLDWVTVRFDPKEDITTFELAKILQMQGCWFTKSSWEAVQPNLRRHFTALDSNGNPL